MSKKVNKYKELNKSSNDQEFEELDAYLEQLASDFKSLVHSDKNSKKSKKKTK